MAVLNHKNLKINFGIPRKEQANSTDIVNWGGEHIYRFTYMTNNWEFYNIVTRIKPQTPVIQIEAEHH